LIQAYEESHRAYHRLDHVVDCLRIFDIARSDADHPAEVEAAIWFHDAVYDPARGDNERRSADWASRVLREAGIDAATSERIQRLIVSFLGSMIPPGGRFSHRHDPTVEAVFSRP